MRTIFDFTDEEKKEADKLIFTLYHPTQKVFYKLVEKFFKVHSIKEEVIKNILDILENDVIIKKHAGQYRTTLKATKIIENYGGLSLYIDSENHQNKNLQLAEKAFKYNRKVLIVTIIALVISVLTTLLNVFFEVDKCKIDLF